MVTESLNVEFDSNEFTPVSLDQIMERILPKVQDIIPTVIGSTNSFTLRVYFLDFNFPSIMDFSPSKFHSSTTQTPSTSKANQVESQGEASKKRKKKPSEEKLPIEFKHVYQVSSGTDEANSIKLSL